MSFEGNWLIRRLDYNALVLDYCRFQIAGGNWSDEVPIFKAQEAVSDAKDNFQLELSFQMKASPEALYQASRRDGQGAIFLVSETPERFQITLNGKPFTWQDAGFWLDTSFRKCSIGAYVKEGENKIGLGAKWERALELETSYIVGDFAVKNKNYREFAIIPEEDVVEGENLVEEGYPFFAGSVELQKTIELEFRPEEAVLSFPDLPATVTEVEINGKIAGSIIWKPHSLEVAEFVKPGENRFLVRLTNTLHNLLGPHHHIRGEILSTSPRIFSDEANWKDEYTLLQWGTEGMKLTCK
ncbi:MAG: hypothetical protein AMS15_06250 [Planctomycetes bacterium DG_23]|nr:MAG: hypothetical protein AMS15_06250 [Planctomycetes bacterium DG_23]